MEDGVVPGVDEQERRSIWPGLHAIQAAQEIEGVEEIPGADTCADAAGLPATGDVVGAAVAEEVKEAWADDPDGLGDLDAVVFGVGEEQPGRGLPENQGVAGGTFGHGPRRDSAAQTHAEQDDLIVVRS